MAGCHPASEYEVLSDSGEEDSFFGSQESNLLELCAWARNAIASIINNIRRSMCCAQRGSSTQLWEAGMKKKSGIGLTLEREMLKPKEIESDWRNIAAQEDIRIRIFKALNIREGREILNRKSKFSKVGVLLHGPAQCGKSTMVEATAKLLEVNLLPLSKHTFAGRSEEKMDNVAGAVLSFVVKARPVLVFLQRLDRITKAQSAGNMHELKRLLLKIIGMVLSSKHSDIYLMATTDNREETDNDVLNRFEVEILVSLPSFSQRESILGKLLEEEPTSCDIDIKELSMLTIGMTAGELTQLCRSAALYRVRDCLADQPWLLNMSKDTMEGEEMDKPIKLRPLNMNDLQRALVEQRKQGNARRFSDMKEYRRLSSYNTFYK